MVDEDQKVEVGSVPVITEETAEELESVFESRERESSDKVEACLFIAGRFLSLQDLVVLTDVNPVMLRQILVYLEKKYSSGVLRLVQRNDAWKMDVSDKYHYLINKLATGSAEFTKAEQETLAVIAYKQPVKQSVVIKIRGNKSYDHVRKFRDLGLVKAVKAGHTLELSLSEEFYEYFNVHKKHNLGSSDGNNLGSSNGDNLGSANDDGVVSSGDGGVVVGVGER